MAAACLLSLAVGITAPPVLLKEPTKPTGEPQTLDELVNAYRWYGLPLLPNAHHVVRWEESEGRIDTKTRKLDTTKIARLGIVVKPAEGVHPALVWTNGSIQEEWRVDKFVTVKAMAACLDGLYYLYWSADEYATLAVYSHLAGWDELATAAAHQSTDDC